MSRTVDDVLRDMRVTFAGRTHYPGQPPRDDELLVAEIKRLRNYIRSLRGALEEAIIWDGSDEQGVAAVWLKEAEEVLRETRDD